MTPDARRSDVSAVPRAALNTLATGAAARTNLASSVNRAPQIHEPFRTLTAHAPA